MITIGNLSGQGIMDLMNALVSPNSDHGGRSILTASTTGLIASRHSAQRSPPLSLIVGRNVGQLFSQRWADELVEFGHDAFNASGHRRGNPRLERQYWPVPVHIGKHDEYFADRLIAIEGRRLSGLAARPLRMT